MLYVFGSAGLCRTFIHQIFQDSNSIILRQLAVCNCSSILNDSITLDSALFKNLTNEQGF